MDHDKAWDRTRRLQRRGGGRPNYGYHDVGTKMSQAKTDFLPSREIRRIYKNAYYHDDLLDFFEKNKEIAAAELYKGHMLVSAGSGKKEGMKEYLYEDAYKAFWGAGLVVLRFKGEHGPRDVLLNVEGMPADERDSLDRFLLERLSPWCRKYKGRVKLVNGLAFYKRPIYDIWELALAPKRDVVPFRTVDQIAADLEDADLEDADLEDDMLARGQVDPYRASGEIKVIDLDADMLVRGQVNPSHENSEILDIGLDPQEVILVKITDSPLLPLGSVVFLACGEGPYMITTRLFTEDEGTKWDFLGCPHPEGRSPSKALRAFDREDVGEVLFIGFQDQEADAEDIKMWEALGLILSNNLKGGRYV